MLRSSRGYDRDAVSKDTAFVNDGVSRTQQQFKEDCDINTIVARYGLTGKVPGNLNMPLPDEFVKVTDFQEALNIVMEGEKEFMRLPAELRAQFSNQPGRLIEFLSDDANRPEAIRLGLVQAPPEVDVGGSVVPPVPDVGVTK